MATEDVKQRAQRVAHESYYGCQRAVEEPGPVNRVVDALSAAGLLRTDLHERALAACKTVARYNPNRPDFVPSHELYEIVAIGREGLDAEQRAREAAQQASEGPWSKRRTVNGWVAERTGGVNLGGLSEPEADAAVSALNEVWRKERKP